MTVAEHKTLRQLQKLVKKSPDKGTQVLRKNFVQWLESGTYKGCAILLGTNYKCLDTYSDNQRVVHEGLHGTLWIGRMASYSFTFTNKDNLETVLEAAYVKAA